MKSTPIKIVAVLIACAACAGGGYWYGQNSGAKTAPKNSATKTSAANRASQSLFVPGGQSVSTLSWQDLLKAKGKMNADTLAAWAKNLSPEEAAAALNGLKGQPANAQRNDLMGALYNAVAERDPQGFLGSLGDITVPRLREGGVDAALKAMAASDPKAALQWIKDNPGTASTSAEQQRFAAAIAGFAANDPAGALAAINALGSSTPQDRQMVSAATQALATTLTSQGQYSQAADLFNQLPAGQTRTDAYSQLAQQWAESSPQDAASWIATLNGDPALKASASMQVAKAWAANDPAAAATWAAQQDLQNADPNAPGTPNGQLLASAIQSWAGYDLDGPGQFLNQLPASPTKDSSVAIFAMSSTSEDPQSAMQWVNTISNDQTRQGATIGVALQWMQQDPAGFNAYVSNSTTLTDQQKQMFSNIPPQIVQRMGQFNTMMGGGNAVQTMMENMLINGGGLGGGGFGGQGGGGNFGGPGGNAGNGGGNNANGGTRGN